MYCSYGRTVQYCTVLYSKMTMTALVHTYMQLQYSSLFTCRSIRGVHIYSLIEWLENDELDDASIKYYRFCVLKNMVDHVDHVPVNILTRMKTEENVIHRTKEL